MFQARRSRDLFDLSIGEDMEAVTAGGDSLPDGDRRLQIIRVGDECGEAKGSEEKGGFHVVLTTDFT
jgi:hypothetical protein